MVIGCEAPVTGLEVNLWNCGGSLAEAGLESPGTTCPGSRASQVRNIQKYLYEWKNICAGAVHVVAGRCRAAVPRRRVPRRGRGEQHPAPRAADTLRQVDI